MIVTRQMNSRLVGANLATCSNFDAFNFITSITQSNVAQGTHVDDIFQDNTGSFSQVLTLSNDCDATTFTDDGDNNAQCENNDLANKIGSVDQLNDATGLDDVLIDQANSVAVSQDLTANNDCNSTALNDAFCDNNDSINEITSIEQENLVYW